MEFIIDNGTLTECRGYDKEKRIIIPDGVLNIGENVFKGLRIIEEVILPESVVSIKANAFKGCKNLRVINFPKGLSEVGDFAFHRCHSLETAVLPSRTKSIGKGAFLYCDSLKRVSVTGAKRFEMQTFANCTALEEIELNCDLDVSNLDDDIFTGCTKINKIVLSDGSSYDVPDLIKAFDSENIIVRETARNVYRTMKFENGHLYRLNVNLKEVNIPEGVTVIEKSCFFDKKGIISISLPESVTRICSNAFGNCINLVKLTIKNPSLKIADIEENAFRGCSSLSEIIFDGSTDVIKKIREQILCDFYISGSTLMRYSGREERVNIPDGIKIISENCFYGNDKAGRVIIPDSVEEIRENAFRNCTSMQSVTVSRNLKKIGRSAFENCRSLLKISLPENTLSIGRAAFKRCRSLSVFETGGRLEYIGDMAFYGCTALKEINIPYNTRLDGDMIFLKSGCERKIIKPYQHAHDSGITELIITTPHIIGKYAFSSCENLESAVITNCVIEDYAFEKCPKLKKISVTASRIGKGVFSFCRNLKEAYIDSVSVGELMFFGCSSIEKISFSENVKTIDTRAFEECTSLTEIPLENIKAVGERAFERCEGLTEIGLCGNKAVGYHAFADCCNLKTINISPETLTESGAFFSCTYVNKIILDGKEYNFSCFSESRNSVSNPFPERVQEIIGDIYSCFDVNNKSELLKYGGNSAKVKIPEDIASIGDEAFRDCLRCVNIDIPPSVGYIGKLTFDGTGWLHALRSKNKMNTVNNMIIDGTGCGEYAEIPAEISKIISWSFAGNTKLRELKFMGDRTAVYEYAFRNCINLRKITLADGTVYTLGDHSGAPEHIKRIFHECINCFKTDETGKLTESTGNIKDLVFPEEGRIITAVGDEVYKNCNLLETVIFSKDTAEIGASAFENSKWLRTVGNAVGVKKIGDCAFAGCQSLETAEFSENLGYIGKRAFEHCCKLKEIIIPKGVTRIQRRTFFRCKSLKEVILPSTLEEIEEEAFAFCEGLEKVIISKNTLVSENAFAFTNAKTEYR